MATYDLDKTFNALAIRDTNDAFSTVSDHRLFSPKTIAICNKMNQSVDLQLQGSFEESFTEVFDIGAEFSVGANTNSWQNASVYFPYLRLKANCATAPTTGALTCYFLKVE